MSADAVNGICDAAATIRPLKTVLLLLLLLLSNAALSDTRQMQALAVSLNVTVVQIDFGTRGSRATS